MANTLLIDTTYASFPDDATKYTIWTGSVSVKDVKILAARLSCCSQPTLKLSFEYKYTSTSTTSDILLITNRLHFYETSYCTDFYDRFVTLKRIEMFMDGNLNYCSASEVIKIKLAIECYMHPSTFSTCPDTSPNSDYSRVTLDLTSPF